jgi:hypothetical protein
VTKLRARPFFTNSRPTNQLVDYKSPADREFSLKAEKES